MVEAETCRHLVTLNRINILNTSCVLTCESLLLICMLIDVAISGDINVIKKEAEKILKYKDLTI